jgi:hypothetical protein
MPLLLRYSVAVVSPSGVGKRPQAAGRRYNRGLATPDGETEAGGAAVFSHYS